MKFTSSSLLPTSFLALAVNAVYGALIPRTTGPGAIERRVPTRVLCLLTIYEATLYNPGGNLGACGNPIQDSDFAVALNSADYANGAHCGQNINVQCTPLPSIA